MPHTAHLKAGLLFLLLQLVMAGLAHGLQVGLIPEHGLITTVWFDVVTYWVGYGLAAALGLTPVEITKEDLQA